MNLYQHFKSVTIIDQHAELEDQLHRDKTLASNLNPQTMIVRFWTAQGVILGKMDTLLPEYEKGLKVFQSSGHKTLVRKAGGLAVVCDSGILNLTIMFSKESPLIGGLNESYDFGIQLMRHLMHDLHMDIQEGEVSNSYCPGKYDLSVKGKKIAGMAQYRSKDTVMLMVTLCVSGNQQKRCALIKNFYDVANPLKDPKYPVIDNQSMETISAITHRAYTVANIKENMVQILHKSGIPVNNQ
ncbi:MAG: Protein:protein lipoyl transferase [Erysipelotrichaceae bacterium]|nr:MAG: Proteinprotein lipoyl [Erysipelotrichaceae bacterium]TXT18336.1 MAG: Protein:protein lipoyl transferase [Erysipelotrichaceae bacterium]